MKEIEVECGCGDIQVFEMDGNEVLYTHYDICPSCGSPPDDYQIEQTLMWSRPSRTSIRGESE